MAFEGLSNLSLISSVIVCPAGLANWDLLHNYKPCWNKILNGAVDRADGFGNEDGSINNWSLLVIKMA